MSGPSELWWRDDEGLWHDLRASDIVVSGPVQLKPRPASTGVDWRGEAFPVNADPAVDTWNGQPIPRSEAASPHPGSDKERLLALLTDFGIQPASSEAIARVTDEACMLDGPGSFVNLLAGEGGVDGYHDFHCAFQFDEDGKFRNVAVWE